jgi:hypothetical protein
MRNYERAEAVYDAVRIGQQRAGAAILRETGHAIEELIKGLIPGLLMMMVTVVATTVIGGVIGAVIGFFFGGAGAAPGAVIGADLGMSAGMAILTWLGLGFLAVGIAQGFGELIGALSHATKRAWNAPDSPRTRAEVEAAGDEYAYAVALLFKLILMAIVARLTMGQAKASTQETLALLRKSKLGEGFAAWVAKNQEALLKNPRLRPKPKPTQSEAPVSTATTPSKAKVESAKPKTEPQAKSAKLKPGSSEHKADRWQRYQDRGGKKSYDQWSKQYDTNMQNYQHGLARESQYRDAMGANQGSIKTSLSNRQIDILKADEMYAGQLKTGPVSLTKENIIAIQKDAELVKQGWTVEHILEQGASKPYLKALDEAGILYKTAPVIP